MEYEINYEHNGDSVTFKNNVKISRMQFDALNRIRGFYTDSTPSFIWQELLRVTENDSSLSVNFNPINLKRNRKEIEYLADSGFYKMSTEEITDNNRKKVRVTLTDIHPALLSIIHLM